MKASVPACCSVALALALTATTVGADTVRVSVTSNGVQAAGGFSQGATVSADGRHVAFQSNATNLVAGDTNGQVDVFVHDRLTGTTTRPSVTTGGVQAVGGPSVSPALSADGRYVAFESDATNLVAGDTNGMEDIFVHDRVAGTTTRVSVVTGGAQATGGGANGSFDPAISPDGRYVAFDSFATNLVAGDTNGQRDVFVHDRVTGTTTRVSMATDGAQATGGGSYQSALNGDARYVAFASDATGLVAGDTNGQTDAFVHDRTTGVTTRVSVATGGIQGTGSGYVGLSPTLSADGRYVAFQSGSANLVVGDTNAQVDVFLHDRTGNVTTRVSLGAGSAEASGGGSGSVALSGDGRYLAFSSSATNLVAGDGNAVQDVFVRDVSTSTTLRVSVGPDGTQANGGSLTPALSADGRYVAFFSSSTNLVPSDTNAETDVFLHDARMFQRRRVSVTSNGTQAAGGSSFEPALSADGRYVAFSSWATNFTDGDTNGILNIFVHDRGTGATSRVNFGLGGVQASDHSFSPRISADGRHVVYSSSALNLVSGDTNLVSDVFVHDRTTGSTTRVSLSTSGGEANSESSLPDISADGRFVAFISLANNLVEGDTNGSADIFVRDRVLNTTVRVSLASGGIQANNSSGFPSLSDDGRHVAFTSQATNLVAGDTNGAIDVFVHDQQTGVTTRVSVGSGGTQTTGDSFSARLNADGRYVAFMSQATNLAPGDTNNVSDVFVHDRQTGSTSRVSVASDGGQALAQNSSQPDISADGRYVTFTSLAAQLVDGDTNGASDIFVHDRVTGRTARASTNSAGQTEVGGDSNNSAMSADGRVIAYASFAATLVPGDTNNMYDIFVRALTPTLDGIAPGSGPITGGTTVEIAGTGFAPGTSVQIGTTTAGAIDSTNPTALSATTGAHPAGLTNVTVTVPGYDPEQLWFAYTYVPPVVPGTDTDGDGLADDVEVAFNLDLLDPSDTSLDCDGDGLSNVAEVGAGTHPCGVFTRYLAEGATSGFFSTSLAVANPGDGTATLLLRYLTGGANIVTQRLTLGPHARTTIDVGSVAGLATAEFSTVLEADRTVAFDRTMRWNDGAYGSHAETAVAAPAQTWYLAEGSTAAGFQLFYLIQNPQPTPAAVTVTYLRPAPAAPLVKTYTIAGNSRSNIWVNSEAGSDAALTGLAATDLSAVLIADQPVIVERAMYRDGFGQVFGAGHESAGVTTPATQWFLAEGATGSYFDLFVLIANPNAGAAQIQGRYLLPDGTVVLKNYQVPGNSRFNIWVDFEDAQLADTAVSTTITVTNGLPVIVERAMWWPGPTAAQWAEAHNSPGATTTGTAWVTASGEDGGATNAETYILIANTAAYGASVRVTLLFEGGTTAVREFPVTAESRFNVAVRAEFPSASGRRFGALLESVGLGAAPLVVEQAIYSDAGGVTWAAGANHLATRLR